MNLLLIAEITDGLSIPDFGSEFEKHIEAKHNPAVYNASCTAWRLLAIALKESGINKLPQVRFKETGKPFFANSPLHFSLSHSGSLAAVLLSDSPCAVDIEIIKQAVQDKLADRCMNEREKTSGCVFFECWTKKECLGKLNGKGLTARPADIDSLDPVYTDYFHMYPFTDSLDQNYQLCALCMNNKKIHIQKIGPEELR